MQDQAHQVAHLQEDLSQRVGLLEASGSTLMANSSNELLHQQLSAALGRDVEQMKVELSLELHDLGSRAAEAATQATEVRFTAFLTHNFSRGTIGLGK